MRRAIQAKHTMAMSDAISYLELSIICLRIAADAICTHAAEQGRDINDHEADACEAICEAIEAMRRTTS